MKNQRTRACCHALFLLKAMCGFVILNSLQEKGSRNSVWLTSDQRPVNQRPLLLELVSAALSLSLSLSLSHTHTHTHR